MLISKRLENNENLKNATNIKSKFDENDQDVYQLASSEEYDNYSKDHPSQTSNYKIESRFQAFLFKKKHLVSL
jgi:hypothetical protein